MWTGTSIVCPRTQRCPRDFIAVPAPHQFSVSEPRDGIAIVAAGVAEGQAHQRQWLDAIPAWRSEFLDRGFPSRIAFTIATTSSGAGPPWLQASLRHRRANANIAPTRRPPRLPRPLIPVAPEV